MYSALTIAVLLIMAVSLAGVLFTARLLDTWVRTRLRYLIAIAAGIFMVIIWGLLEEAFHETTLARIVPAFLLGALLLAGVTRLLPKDTHHHHGPHPHPHTPIDARRMLLGDAVHNIHDGLVLVPAFLVSPLVGFGTTAAILLHELVQEIAEYFVLREAGYSARRALTWNFIVSATILIGVVLSATLAGIAGFGPLLVAFAAGGFTYILLRDLLPSIVHHARAEGAHGVYVTLLLLGAALMVAVGQLAPDVYHEVHDEDEEATFLLPPGFDLV